MPQQACIEVVRCAEGRWELRRMAPAPDLAGMVLGYQGYVEPRGRLLRQRQPAGTFIPVIVNFGPAFRVGLGQAAAAPVDQASFVAGLEAGPATVEATGASCCMQVDFTPLGAYRFFQLPMRDLAGQVVDLADACGGDVPRLAARLHDAADWCSRFVLLDGFVRERLRGGRAPSGGVAWAWRQLSRTQGRARIGALGRELGWSRKHLAERFAIEVGRPPKTVARLMRFERVQGLAQQGSAPDWSDIAAGCGYADQAHMIRDFRAFAGLSPAAYRAGGGNLPDL